MGGRTVAVVVITVVAALSFTLGYKVGRSGLEGNGGPEQVQVVPEGAGLVLLGANNACEESTSAKTSPSAVAGSSPAPGAVLETIKAASLPKPDTQVEGAGPDEPVIEPLGQKQAPAKKEAGTPSVAPIGQLPHKQEEPPAATKKAPEPPAPKAQASPTKPSTSRPEVKAKAKEKPAAPSSKKVAQKKPVPQKRPMATSDGTAYSVQVGAFRSLSDARTHRVRFTQKGYNASVYKDREPGGSDIFKVRVGMFISRHDAEKMVRRLKSTEGVNGFVTPIK